MTESPLEYSFEDLFVGQKANFLKKIDEALVNDFAKIMINLTGQNYLVLVHMNIMLIYIIGRAM